MARSDRNPLACPLGVVPGFDPNHIASKGIVRFSGISTQSTFINLLTGTHGSTVGTGTANMDGIIGPSVKYPVSVTPTNFTGQSTANDQTATIACIFRMVAQDSTFHALFGGTSDASNGWTLFGDGSASTRPMMHVGGGNISTTTLTILSQVPYFLVASANAASGLINFVLCRLDSGQVFSEGVGATLITGAPNGTYLIGDWAGVGLPTNGSISRAMFSNAFLSMQECQQMAADPWSFWHPDIDGAQFSPRVGVVAGDTLGISMRLLQM